MARTTGKHSVGSSDESGYRIATEQDEVLLLGESSVSADCDRAQAFEEDFFGSTEDAAPQAVTLMVQSARYRVIHENPEERPFARGAVLEKIEDGDKDAYLSKRTETARRRRRRIYRALTAMVVLALVAGIGFHLHASAVAYDSAEGDFKQAVSLMQGTDEVVVGLDAAVNSQVTADRLADLQTLLDQVPDTEDRLQQVIDMTDRIEPAMKQHNNGDIVAQLRTSAQARLTMLEAGSQLIDYDIKAMRASESFAEAWTLILDADTRSRAAGAFVAYATTNNVNQALNLNAQALTDLSSAKEKLGDVSDAFSEVDLTSLEGYVDAKTTALGYAAAADRAYLSGDTSTSAAQIALYDTADQQAVGYAAKLPSDPAQIILGAYDKATAPLRKTYVEARQQASDADAAVRNYLGINEVITDTTATGNDIVTEESAATSANTPAAS